MHCWQKCCLVIPIENNTNPSQELRIEFFIRPAILNISIYLKGSKTLSKNTCTLMFIAAIFTIFTKSKTVQLSENRILATETGMYTMNYYFLKEIKEQSHKICKYFRTICILGKVSLLQGLISERLLSDAFICFFPQRLLSLTLT